MSNNDGYLLGRGLNARNRLNLQHFLYRKMFGYILDPAIPRGENLRVADVATGSGIWMLDVMSELPTSTSYNGFDIDLAQTPPKEWIPPNMSFAKLDLYDELPPEFESQFDIINIRLVMLVVKGNDPTSVLQKLYRMLKPGGWLQWTETDITTVYTDFIKAQPTLSSTAMKKMHENLIPNDPRYRSSWVLELHKFFETCGFHQVQQEWKHSEEFLPWLAFISDMTTTVYREAIDKLPIGANRTQLENVYDQAAQETLDGSAWNAPRVNVIGQKPF